MSLMKLLGLGIQGAGKAIIEYALSDEVCSSCGAEDSTEEAPEASERSSGFEYNKVQDLEIGRAHEASDHGQKVYLLRSEKDPDNILVFSCREKISHLDGLSNITPLTRCFKL